MSWHMSMYFCFDSLVSCQYMFCAFTAKWPVVCSWHLPMNTTSNHYHCTINLFYFAGFLIDFISGPVSVGFTSAAAIIIATTQIKDVLGLSFPGSKFLDVWEQLFEHISETRLWDTLLGFICMAVLLLLRVTTQYYLMKRKKDHDCFTWPSYHDVNLIEQCRWHPCRPAACWGVGGTYRMLKFVMPSIGLDSVPLTEGSILDHCCEIWE